MWGIASMNGKQYKLRFLPLFEDDLNGIVDYIVGRLKNPIAAETLVNDVQKGNSFGLQQKALYCVPPSCYLAPDDYPLDSRSGIVSCVSMRRRI